MRRRSPTVSARVLGLSLAASELGEAARAGASVETPLPDGVSSRRRRLRLDRSRSPAGSAPCTPGRSPRRRSEDACVRDVALGYDPSLHRRPLAARRRVRVVAAVSTSIVVAQFSSGRRPRSGATRSSSPQAAPSSPRRTSTGRTSASGCRDVPPSTSISTSFVLRDRRPGSSRRRRHARRSRARRLRRPRARRAARAGERRVLSTSDGGIVVIGTRSGQVRSSRSRRPDVAAAVGILNDQALRAGVIAGVVGILVGLLLAQLIALRLRRLTARGGSDRARRLRVAAALPLPRRVRRARAELRSHAPAGARSFRHIEGERDRLRLLLERLHEGVVTVDGDSWSSSRTRRRGACSAAARGGRSASRAMAGFSLRDFAARLFDPTPRSRRRTCAGRASTRSRVVGIPAQPEGDTC